MGIGPFPRNEAKNDFFSSAKSVFQEGSCARSKESQHPLMPIMEIVMPRRKSKFQDSEFVRIATFSVGSERLRIDEGGRIEEDPELLISFGKLVDQMSVAAGVNFKFCQICVLEGAYVSDVLGVKSLANQRDEIVALFNRFEDDVEKLERNVDADEPGNASKCGVSNMSLGVLEASAALSGSSGEAKANIMLDDGHKIDLSVPSQEAIAALPLHEKKPKKVDGEVTGMGYGDERGARLEVGRGMSYIVTGLGIDEAFAHVRSRVNVTCIATWDRDGAAYIIDNPTYADTLDL